MFIKNKFIKNYFEWKKDVLNVVCIKNGFKIHGDTIIEWIENIYQIELKDEILFN